MSWATLLAFAALAVLVSAQGTLPPGAPATITVQFIIRDFVGVCSACGVNGDTRNKTTHRDFERVIASDVGIVQTTLGADRKPVLSTSVVPATWTNSTLFRQAWNDVPGVNIRLTRNFQMSWDNTQGLYVYNNGNFYPIDNDGYGNYYNNHNYHFCLEYHTQFKYRGTETFSFTGDDDVYFFVNNQLFVDLGGVHGAQSVTKDLKNTATALSQYGMSVGGVYNFDFFYCERHTTESNLKMATNILLNDCPFIDACGDCYTVQTASTILVNPCNVLNCNQGTCNCRTGNCTCLPGWTDGPNGSCSQNCGDGILQGNEQCDPPGPCCSSTCKFIAANTTCPSLGKSCVNYVCSGNSVTCGTPRPIGSACTGTTNAPQCQQYQCTAADGSTCGLVVNTALGCTDNNACTTDICLSTGVCQSTSTVCNATACRNAGVCDTTTGICSQGTAKADGTGCGADPGTSSCVLPTCSAGTCNPNSPKPINTPCGSVSIDGCSTQVCNGAGTCGAIAVTSAQGTTASCTQLGAGSCLQALCSGTACVNSPIPDGSTCSQGAPSVNSCQRSGCVNGTCVAIADSAREGQTCTDGAPLNAFGDDQCNMKICVSGACVRKANPAIDGNNCNIGAGPNPEQTCRTYTCAAGTCVKANINEAAACVNAALVPTNCSTLQCVSGTCTITFSNNLGKCNDDTNNGCTLFRCDNAGNCNSQPATLDKPCGPTNLQCNLSFCTAAGLCVQKPVICDPSFCSGNLVCNQTLGVCELPASKAQACCGNGVLDSAAEQCDDPLDPCCINCLFAAAGTTCGPANDCNPKTCKQLNPPQINTTCSDNIPPTAILCTSAAEPTNQCLERRCGGAVCSVVNKTDDTPCSLNNVPYCGLAVCRGGNCQVVPNAALAGTDCGPTFGTVPQCNQAVCTGTQCVLADFGNGSPCTALPSVACRDRICSAGSCVYDTTNFPKSLTQTCVGATSNTECLVPGCDGAGNCILLNNTAGIPCTRTNNPDCNTPQCDSGGQCILAPINQGQPCAAARDLQCQLSTCDPNGNCAVVNVTNGTPCTRPDVGQCQDSVCTGGACVLVNTATQRACTTTLTALSDPNKDLACSDFYCQADGSCDTPSDKTDGTACTDANLCDTDTCKAGKCTHVVSVVCNTPTLPCEVPIGTCIAAFGNCTYSGRGQYSACNPRAAELDSRCNASISGEYRCATGAPDSVCTPACFAGGVCGDGIVQAGEDCDWGDVRTGGPCCNFTCKWFEELAPCNDTDPLKVAAVAAQVADLSKSSGLPALCFVQRCVTQSGASQCVLGLDTTIDKKCASTGNSKSNRTAILASVIPGALIALCLAALGFFLWRRAQKAAEGEWLQEYLNAGNVRVENNAAFVNTQKSVDNAAFQPN